MSSQYIQDKDISVCTLGAHQALIKVISQNKVKRSNGKLLATENDRMGECYGCYKSPAYISVLSTILMTSSPLRGLCLLGSVAGALGGAFAGFLRGSLEGEKIGESVGKIGGSIGGVVGSVIGRGQGGRIGTRLGFMGGAAVGLVGTYTFLHGKVSEMLKSIFMPNICASYTKLSIWSKVHPHVKIQGQKALLEGATLTCVQGGLITIIKPDFSEAANMLCLSYFAYNRTSIEKPKDDYDMNKAMEGLSQQQQNLLRSEKLKGYEKLSDEKKPNNKELAELGLSVSDFHDSSTGFKADIYKDKNGNYVLTYRGTYSEPDRPENDLVHDWSKEWTDDNLRQGLGIGSGQYEKSIKLAERINRNKPSDKQLTITGHSLGGGLATAAGAATGSKTYAFCPAGVHSNTYKMYNVDHPNTSKIHTYYSNQDFLNMASNNISFMPKAAGERIMLHTMDSFSFARGHDLPLLFKAIQAEQAKLGKPIRANKI